MWASDASKTSPPKEFLQTLWDGKENPAAKPPDHIIFSNYFFGTLSIIAKNYVVKPAFPLVLHITLVFCAGEPKKGFAGGTYTPLYQIYLTYIALRAYSARVCKVLSKNKYFPQQLPIHQYYSDIYISKSRHISVFTTVKTAF